MEAFVNERERIQRCLLDTGIRFKEPDKVPWLIAAAPHPLTSSQGRELKDVGEACLIFCRIVQRAIAQNDRLGQAICRIMGGSELRQQLARAVPAHVNPTPMIRPDVFWDEHGTLTIVEAELMIGGLGMSTTVRAGYETRGFVGTEQGYLEMLTHLEIDPGLIAVVNPAAKNGYDGEFEVFHRALARHVTGIDLRISRPHELTADTSGSPTLAGQKIDLIHRFFRLSELGDESPETVALLKSATAGKTRLIQPWNELLEEKGLMALFHDQSFRQYWLDALGHEAFARLGRAFPPTWLVSPDNDALVRRMLTSERTGRPFWLKKSGDSWGGRDAIDGSSTTTNKWRAAVEAAYNGFSTGNVWILQERRVCAPTIIPFFDECGNVVDNKPMNLRISPFFFTTRSGLLLADVAVTARTETKVHGASNAVITAATMVDG